MQQTDEVAHSDGAFDKNADPQSSMRKVEQDVRQRSIDIALTAAVWSDRWGSVHSIIIRLEHGTRAIQAAEGAQQTGRLR